MREIIVDYLFDLKAARRSEATLSSYCQALRDLVRFLWDCDIHDFREVGVLEMRTYLNSLQDAGLKPGTIRLRATILSCFFNWCVQERIIEENPMLHVRRPKNPRQLRKVFSEGELFKIFTAVEHTHDPIRNRAMLYILLDCGLRASELLSLKREQYDAAKGMLTVNGKGKHIRMVMMGQRCKGAFEAHLERVDGSLWGITREDFGAILHRLGQKADTEANPHKWRRTFANRFLDAGGTIEELQYLMGHSDISTTMIYAEAGQQARALRSHAEHSPLDNLAPLVIP